MELNGDWAPLQNSAALRRKCHARLPHERITAELRAYFSVRHAGIARPLIPLAPHRIGDALALAVTAAEVFSADPGRWLLERGVVVFPDLLCLELRRVSEWIALSVAACHRLLEGNHFAALDAVPDDCRALLCRLGFVDSPAFQLFAVPPADAFAFAIRAHRAVVQPFPAELVDAMVGARRAAAERARSAVGDYVAAAQARLQQGGGTGTSARKT
jgi:hypothetical protein